MLMALSIFLEGKEYISAIRASKKIGYARDYIGQLCRAKKIPGKLIGKTWYVDFTSLLEHRRTRKLGKKRKVASEAIPSIAQREPDVPLRETVNNVEITYEKEEVPWLPTLSKKSRFVEPIWNKRRVKRAQGLSLGVVIDSRGT